MSEVSWEGGEANGNRMEADLHHMTKASRFPARHIIKTSVKLSFVQSDAEMVQTLGG